MSQSPADSSLETKFTLPPTWYRESSDPFGGATMFLSGLILLGRNRYLAWPTLLISISSFINGHPLRSKEGASGGWSGVSLSFMALVASYLPLFMLGQ